MKTESILNVDCSMFANAKATDPKSINLLSWLTSNKYLTRQTKVRSETDPNKKRIAKEAMPCITASGVFSKRGKRFLKKHTGFIAIDIDQKANDHIENYSELKKEISKIDEVAYCGLSVSGSGYWALIPIDQPENHEQHFEFIRLFFEGHGVNIDRSCADVSRLRFYSHDPEAYFNHAAKPLKAIYRPQAQKQSKSSFKSIEGQEDPVWEIYNNNRDFIEVLTDHGWAIESDTGKKTFFTRPGKTSGVSAEFDSEKNVFFVFTENGQPFESNTGYNPFQVYTLLNHKGDFKAATKALVAKDEFKNS